MPYRGGAPALQDLMAGQIDLAILDPPTFLPALRAGLVKAYAVMAKDRLAAARDIPTVDEAGLQPRSRRFPRRLSAEYVEDRFDAVLRQLGQRLEVNH